MSESQRLTVGSRPVTADAGSGAAPVLRVRRGGADSWESFYDEIHGFEYVPGFRYELDVAVSEVEAPAADGSSLRYDLIRVVARVQE